MFGIALWPNVFIHLFYQVNEICIGAQCTVHVEDSASDFPVNVIAIPFIRDERIAQSLGKTC